MIENGNKKENHSINSILLVKSALIIEIIAYKDLILIEVEIDKLLWLNIFF